MMRTSIVAGLAAFAIVCAAPAGAKPARGFDAPYDAPRSRPASRPPLKFFFISPSGAFRFHYDTSATSVNAVPPLDSDGDKVPDWIESAAEIADHVVAGYGAMGYDTAVGDGGADGGTEYDIYFLQNPAPDQGPVYGVTFSPPDPYINLHRNFEGGNFATHGLEALSVTIAHEMFHAVQFRYVPYYDESSSWWMEMTATFMEEVFYDDINDYYDYLNPQYFTDPIFRNPALGLDYGYSSHPYSAVVFLKYLSEMYGAEVDTLIRDTFVSRNLSLSNVVNSIVRNTGETMANHLATFWAWSYYTGGRTRPEYFREGASYRPAPLESPYPDNAVTSISFRGVVRDTVGTAHVGASILRVPPDGSKGSVTIRVTEVSQIGKWAWRLAVTFPDQVSLRTAPAVPTARATPAAQTFEFEIGAADWQRATDVVLIAANGVTAANSPTPTKTAQFSYEIAYRAPVAIAENTPLPARTEIGPPSPNPFNAYVRIPLSLDRAESVDLAIYDAAGRPVRTLVAAAALPAGRHEFTWDGRSDTGLPAGSGVYVIRLRAGAANYARTTALLR